MLRRSTLLLLLATACSTAFAQAPGTFTNPIRSEGPDPWIEYRDGFWYLMTTTNGRNLTIWKASTLGGLKNAKGVVVWPLPGTSSDLTQLWAPELHRIDDKWYIYFTADFEDKNEKHRIWVLENSSGDPTSRNWAMKCEVSGESDRWAIDASVFENRHHWYLIWSGWADDTDGVQNIYIARLKNPWTIEGERVKISYPQFPWEKVGDRPNQLPPHVDVNEGPEILFSPDKSKIFLVYSASGCWTDYYELGMLSASADSNLLDPASWKKSPQPVFAGSPEAHAYGVGHNGFFKSPDGKQDWIIYHANPDPNEGCAGWRSTRAQPFTWNPDGTPNFGKPVPLGIPLAEPSGEQVH
jgi:GH43 family beta-xylosidase